MANKTFRFDGIGIALLGLIALALAIFAIASGMQPRITDAGCVNDCLARYDLLAQSQMAWAAWAMVAVTVFSTVLGFVSLWLIRENLIEARLVREEAVKSTNEASKASAAALRGAKASESAVREAQNTTLQARELGKKQFRAYLVVGTIEAFVNHDNSVAVIITVINSGQSHASFVSVTARVHLAVQMFDEPFYDEDFSREEFLPDIAVGNKAQFDGHWRIKNTESAHGFGRYMTVKVVGSLHYSDIFGDRQLEPFEFISKKYDSVGARQVEMKRAPVEFSLKPNSVR